MAGSSIFQGVTISPCRDFVAREIVEAGAKEVYLPCAGRFGIVEAFVRHGGNAAFALTSDICMFSSIVGYLADPKRDLAELELRLHEDLEPGSDDPMEVASCVMLKMKINQLNLATQYGLNIRREIMSNLERHKAAVKARLETLVTNLRGISYEIRDVMEVIAEASGKPDAALFVNVPTYGGGYSRMFSGKGITWKAPTIAQFDYKRFQDLLLSLAEVPCLSFVYVQKKLPDTPLDGWQVAYAHPFGKGRIDYVICNRRVRRPYAVTSAKDVKVTNYPIYNDEEITEDSVVTFVNATKDTVLYYRDLFVHKLGITAAERYYLMLIDGRVVTALGLALREFMTRRSEYIGEVFGISKSSIRYKRLGKLFMLCLTSAGFKRILERDFRFGVRKLKGIQTTSITTFEEGKTDRSVMKLVSREQLKNGNFKIIYRADFRDDTFKDCVSTWLKKWGNVRRENDG